MAFVRLNYGKNWTSAEDFPTYEDSEVQVRADLQYHPDAVRTYLNDTLLTTLEGAGCAGELGTRDGKLQKVLDEAMDRLTQAENDILDITTGGGTSVNQCACVSFDASQWTRRGDGDYVLSIPKSKHKRTSDAFGYCLWQSDPSAPFGVEWQLRSDLWGVAATRVFYNRHTGDMSLTAPEAYGGTAAFFGM